MMLVEGSDGDAIGYEISILALAEPPTSLSWKLGLAIMTDHSKSESAHLVLQCVIEHKTMILGERDKRFFQ